MTPPGEPAAGLSWRAVDASRLTRQHLANGAQADGPEAVASSLLGIHAQMTSAAELIVRARVRDLAGDAVSDALWNRRTLVKTWAMRGTLHLLPSAEFGTFVAALGTRTAWRRPVWLRAFGVTLELMEALHAAITDALDGRSLTREELASEVGRRLGGAVPERLRSGWGELLKPAAQLGLLCFGPSQGQRVTFVRPDQWLPGRPAKAVDRAEALQEIGRRYLRTYGPATHEDFARWWGVEPAAGRRVFRSLADEVVEADVEGHRAWLLRGDTAPTSPDHDRSNGRIVRLLPNFDPYLIGYQPRSRLIPAERLDRVFRVAGWISPVVLVDGAVAGVWEQQRRGRRLELRVDPFRRLTAEERRGVEQEAADIGRLVGLAPAVTFGPRATRGAGE